MRRALLIAAALLTSLAGGVALAQPTLYDLEQLPAFHGALEAYLLTPGGELDGFFLENGTEVHVPCQISSELAYAVKPGDRVTVHGLRATDRPMIQALLVSNDVTAVKASVSFPLGWPGPQFQCNRPPQPPRFLEARGRIKWLTHGAEGEINGVMLDDRTILRFAERLVPEYPDCLVPGRDIAAGGNGLSSALGKVLEVRSVSLVPAVPDGPTSPQSRCALIPISPADRAIGKLPLLNPPPKPPEK